MSINQLWANIFYEAVYLCGNMSFLKIINGYEYNWVCKVSMSVASERVNIKKKL